MLKMILAIMATMMVGHVAGASCNPCICGPGGGMPIPPECPNAGHWKQHAVIPQRGLETLHAVLSDKNVEIELLGAGGLADVKCVESANAISFQFKAENGTEFVTPSFVVPAQ
ncbi:hypothetical protein [Bdellovibrio sp. NC01]|uniref:hypothetical protein n=1 Tax=Bdellovibrio sp. NC01 TaxID=2220073 RepID=UPI0011597F0E|nr:hypothetical protein [Bdellovibrio sp. NC01]QDK38620.1 hypothetical protein DOE51_14035 [Bdellovibrio sp. NC01]